MKHRDNVRSTILLLGASVLCVSAWAVPPAEAIVTRTETVKFSRASAETPAGAVELYGALQAAASRTCRDEMAPTAWGASHAECADAALAKAVDDVNIAAVSAIYLQHGKFQGKKGIVTVAKR